MTVFVILSWMLCGLIVGLFARFLGPRRLEVGLFPMMGLGMVGAVLGGFLYSFMQGPPSELFSLSGNAWQVWIVSILGAMLVLLAYGIVYPKERSQ